MPFKSRRKWTPERFEILKAVVGKCSMIRDVPELATKVLGFKVTAGQVRNIFLAYEAGPPSAYLKGAVSGDATDALARLAAVEDDEEFTAGEMATHMAIGGPDPEADLPPGLDPGHLDPQTVNVPNFEIMYKPAEVIPGEAKWLLYSDTHCPWHDRDALAEMFASRFAQEADGVVIVGDLLDNPQFSKHERTRDEPLSVDYMKMCEHVIVPTLALPRVKQVVVVAGNHDNWTVRYGQRRIQPDAFFMLRDLVGHDLMEVLGRIKLDVPDDRLRYRFGVKNWFAKIGDCIFAHPTTFLAPTKGEQRPGRTAWERFAWFRLRNPHLRALVIGHTHRLHRERTIPSKYGEEILTMEIGCMQLEAGAEYTMKGNSKYDPFHVGYGELVQVDGVTDFSRTRYVHLKTV